MSTMTGSKPKDQFRTDGTGQEIIDKAKELGGTVVDKTKDAAATVAENFSQAAKVVGHKADQLASGAGTGIKNLGETIKEQGPQEGMIGDATKSVGATLEQGGKYLEEAGLSGMFGDLTEVIKRNPIPAVAVGVGLGLLLGRALRSGT